MMIANSYEKLQAMKNNTDLKDVRGISDRPSSSSFAAESVPLSSMRPQSSASKSVIKNLYQNNITRNN
jgi:hypothetical protein